MKKLSETLTELGIAFSFPIEINDAKGNKTYCERSSDRWYRYEYDAKGNETYYEDSDDYWERCEYDADGNETYHESIDDYWHRCEYDADGNVTYFEDSNDYWCKYEYDAKGNESYFEDIKGKKRGTPKSAKTCAAKMVIRFTPIDGYTPFIAEYLKGAETLETRPAR
jgi:hypothetical protein